MHIDKLLRHVGARAIEFTSGAAFDHWLIVVPSYDVLLQLRKAGLRLGTHVVPCMAIK